MTGRVPGVRVRVPPNDMQTAMPQERDGSQPRGKCRRQAESGQSAAHYVLHTSPGPISSRTYYTPFYASIQPAASLFAVFLQLDVNSVCSTNCSTAVQSEPASRAAACVTRIKSPTCGYGTCEAECSRSVSSREIPAGSCR